MKQRYFLLFLLLSLLFLANVVAYASPKKAREIFEHLSRNNNISAKLIYDREHGPMIAAYPSDYEVVYNGQFLYRCSSNSNCYNGILAHELAHIKLMHVNGNPQQIEFEADKEMIYILKKAGFDPCLGLRPMRLSLEIDGDQDTETHPAWSKRIARVSKECVKAGGVLP